MARLVDVSGSLSEYNDVLSPEEADTLGLLADWLVVGDDLREAILIYRELTQQKEGILTQEQKKQLTLIGK